MIESFISLLVPPSGNPHVACYVHLKLLLGMAAGSVSITDYKEKTAVLNGFLPKT